MKDLQYNNKNIKRQSELAISIVQENKWLNNSYERFTTIAGEKICLSFINPRFLYEKGYNSILMKSDNNTKKDVINRYIISNRKIDLSKRTEQLDLNPMLFYMPNAKIYSNNIILFDDKHINKIKEELHFINNENNCSLSSLNYLIIYPEHQPMTRFMYPNPKLIRKI